jgi:hypothetical protein
LHVKSTLHIKLFHKLILLRMLCMAWHIAFFKNPWRA